MALAIGTNAGFVTTAPTTDPDGPSEAAVDGWLLGQEDTAPDGAGRVVEVGWYCVNATEAADFEVGLYSDAGADEPETRLFVNTGNAKGTDAGWKSVTGLNWAITAGTVYWIAFQLDATATATDTDYITTGGPGFASSNGARTTLPSDWGTSDNKLTAGIVPIYAVWEPTSNLLNSKLLSGGLLMGGRLVG